MELALQVVGLKMTGRIEEAKNVAMRIVGNNNNGDSELSSMASSGLSTMNSLVADAEAVSRSVHSRAGSDSDSVPHMLSSSSSRGFQSVIIEFLHVLDIDVPSTSVVTMKDALSHPNNSGQTLLHLSAILGFHRLLKHLISRGIDMDARDVNGYTALHFAALCGRVACARILVEGGADVEIVEARGRTAREIAGWRDQVDVEVLLEGVESQLVLRSSLSNGDEADESDIDESHGDDTSLFDPEDAGESQDLFGPSSPTLTVKHSRTTDVDDTFRHLSDSGSSSDENELPEREPQYGEKKIPLEPLDIEPSLPPPDYPTLAPEKTLPSLFHRTLSHLQPPPLPTFRAMPGLPMPQWALLPNQIQFPHLQFPQLPNLPLHFPDIPMVFPAQMPTPSWPASFPWQGNAAQGGKSEQHAQEQQQQQNQGLLWGAYGLGSPWLGFYPGRWTSPNQEKEREQDPPMYTPPASGTTAVPDPLVMPPSAGEPVAEFGSDVPTPKQPHFLKPAKLVRRGSHKQSHFSERDICAHEYRSAKMQKLKSMDFFRVLG